ncbi:MAG: hypothetical protein RIC30_05910 [Marinoscillum sp.]|uniref:hypothetical protein n=1 Tax=Marinoscillum sp. TaxID=2024838 RepID=UPI0032FB1D9C
MQTIKYLLLAFTIFTLSGCFSKSEFPSKEEEQRTIEAGEVEGHWIKFYKIDNQVKVFINGELAFDSGKGLEKKDEDVSFGFTEQLRTGKNKIRIELYNEPPYEGFMGFDKNWEIFYELFREDIPVNYIHEKDDNGQKGMVWSIEHEILVE